MEELQVYAKTLARGIEEASLKVHGQTPEIRVDSLKDSSAFDITIITGPGEHKAKILTDSGKPVLLQNCEDEEHSETVHADTVADMKKVIFTYVTYTLDLKNEQLDQIWNLWTAEQPAGTSHLSGYKYLLANASILTKGLEKNLEHSRQKPEFEVVVSETALQSFEIHVQAEGKRHRFQVALFAHNKFALTKIEKGFAGNKMHDGPADEIFMQAVFDEITQVLGLRPEQRPQIDPLQHFDAPAKQQKPLFEQICQWRDSVAIANESWPALNVAKHNSSDGTHSFRIKEEGEDQTYYRMLEIWPDGDDWTILAILPQGQEQVIYSGSAGPKLIAALGKFCRDRYKDGRDVSRTFEESAEGKNAPMDFGKFTMTVFRAIDQLTGKIKPVTGKIFSATATGDEIIIEQMVPDREVEVILKISLSANGEYSLEDAALPVGNEPLYKGALDAEFLKRIKNHIIENHMNGPEKRACNEDIERPPITKDPGFGPQDDGCSDPVPDGLSSKALAEMFGLKPGDLDMSLD